MIKLKPIALAVVGCGLVQACSAPPVSRTLAVSPVVRGEMPGNQAASWNRLGRFHHERGQLALALGAYAQSLALDASQLEARNAVAVIEAQQGNLEAARGALVALVNDYPGEAQPHTNLGYVQYLMGDHAGATQTLRRAMALGAGPKAFQNLQLAEAAMGKAPAGEAPQLAAAKPAAPAAAATADVAAHAGPEAPAAAGQQAVPVAAAPRALPAMPALAATAPQAIAAPALDSPAALAVAAAPAAPRIEPGPLTVLPTSSREIGSHMELVQLAANVYELKTRVPPAAPAAVQALAQAGKVRMARLEVANGNGVAGMARRFRSLLGQMGIPVDRLSNEKPYNQVATTIQYSPGFERQAAGLQKALQGKAQLASRQLAAADVRLVLGKDASLTLTAATEAAGLSLVAMADGDSN
jgi:tetratricopeptide (TPR) repeat protein